MSERYFYAQLKLVEGEQRVASVSNLSGEVTDPLMILLNDLQDAEVGDIYQDGVFTKPDIPDGSGANTRITRLAFLNRFTDAEAIALDLASVGATVEAATIRRYMSKVNAASYIDLSRDDTIAGVNALATAGLITATRANEIITAPVQTEEVYN